MDERENVNKSLYFATVQRLNRLETVLIICGAMFVSLWGSEQINKHLDIEIMGEVIFLGIMILACFVMAKLEPFFPSVETVSAYFEEEGVRFQRGRRERWIAYTDIIEVQKMMVINRFHSEKGYYRVNIKTKRGAYALYTGEDSSRKLDFNETELSNIYFGFKNRGIKCC